MFVDSSVDLSACEAFLLHYIAMVVVVVRSRTDGWTCGGAVCVCVADVARFVLEAVCCETR